MSNYLLLDSRAGIEALKTNGSLSHIHDWDKFILFTGTLKECCDYANDGTYGSLCVVADLTGLVRFDLFVNNKWEC